LIRHPEIPIPGFMQNIFRYQKIQDLLDLYRIDISKPFSDLERELESGAADMVKYDQQIIWINQCLLGRFSQ